MEKRGWILGPKNWGRIRGRKLIPRWLTGAGKTGPDSGPESYFWLADRGRKTGAEQLGLSSGLKMLGWKTGAEKQGLNQHRG